jgi:hypothetical protein
MPLLGLLHAKPICRRLDVDSPAACARRLSAARVAVVSRAAHTQRRSDPASVRHHAAGGCIPPSGSWRGKAVWCGVTSPFRIPLGGGGGGGGGGGREPHRGRPLGLSGGRRRPRPWPGNSSVWLDVAPGGAASHRALGSHGSGNAEQQEQEAAVASGSAAPPVSSRGDEGNPFDDWQVCT